jgi:hypothetical protein
MGRTKGGLNTKIHAVVNARSQAVVWLRQQRRKRSQFNPHVIF